MSIVHRRLPILVVLALLATAVFVIGRHGGAPAQGAATPPTYTKTVAGTDFESLDYRFATQFLSGTGGGVYLVEPQPLTNPPSNWYVETNLELPVGAKVTEVSVFFRTCGGRAYGYFG